MTDTTEEACLLPGFEHRPGKHCGSTALANVMRYHGHDMSESLCFGLSSGLGCFYAKDPRFSPSRVFWTRALALEHDFFQNLDLPFEWHSSESFPWAEMRTWLDRGVPILLLTDLYYLPHYGKSTHFTGHGVVLVGYSRDTALLADTHLTGLMPVPLDDLAAAMNSPRPPMPVRNNWREVLPFASPDLAWAAQRALIANARAMLEPPAENMGVPGMRQAIAGLARWNQAEDWQWCARFGYQIIERRGTGGGGFRLMYADFLDEVSPQLPVLIAMVAAGRMREIAALWTDLSEHLKGISESDSPAGFEPAALILVGIAELEQGFFRDIVTSFPGSG